MDGCSLLRLLPEHNVRATVVVMSGHGEIDDAMAALRSGAVDYLKKPWRTSDLAAAPGRALAVFDELADVGAPDP
jgi:FixJ family two-component response regulator